MKECLEFVIWILCGYGLSKIFHFSGIIDVLFWPFAVLSKLWNKE